MQGPLLHAAPQPQQGIPTPLAFATLQAPQQVGRRCLCVCAAQRACCGCCQADAQAFALRCLHPLREVHGQSLGTACRRRQVPAEPSPCLKAAAMRRAPCAVCMACQSGLTPSILQLCLRLALHPDRAMLACHPSCSAPLLLQPPARCPPACQQGMRLDECPARPCRQPYAVMLPVVLACPWLTSCRSARPGLASVHRACPPLQAALPILCACMPVMLPVIMV